MSYPTQTFNTFNQLLDYINTNWIANNQGKITGTVGNNVVNGLLTFITQSPLNWNKCTVVSSSAPITAGSTLTPGPIILMAGVPPATVAWQDSIYNQYIFINTTGSIIPLASSFFYNDAFGNIQTNLLPNQVTVIFKTPTNTWVQGNNPTATGNVPSPGGAAGKFLTNNGVISTWSDTFRIIQPSSFTSATTFSDTSLSGKFFSLFINDISRFLNGPNDVNTEWQYFTGGGFHVTFPGFNLQTLTNPVYMFFKSTP